jgi:lipopolysaccharide transport system ATP-binding protein
MSDIAIRVENLGKQYKIGVRQASYSTLRDSLTEMLSAPFRRLWHEETGINADRGDRIWALHHISFEVRQGEVLGIIGRNGAGKSTLLKILSRITEPTEGYAEIHGRVGSLLEVGTGFHPELTGRENIYLNGAILGMKKREIERKFDEIVAFAEVEKFVDTPVKHYSSGMYLRLAFSVAAHLQPEILLVDEVLAVGDVEFQKKCMGRVEKIADEGKTVVVVSHNMSTVKALCSQAILLENGTIKAIGTVDAVVAEYLSAKVDTAEKVLSNHDHDVGGGSAMRVKRIRLLNKVMNSFSVYWRQPISVSLEMEVFEPIEDVSFGAAIRLADGTFVFVTYNDDGRQPRWILEPGEYTVEFTLQNDLKPGLYTLHVGAYQRYIAVKNLFAVDAVHIEVLGFTEQGVVPSAADPGLIRGVKSTFSFEKLRGRELPK